MQGSCPLVGVEDLRAVRTHLVDAPGIGDFVDFVDGRELRDALLAGSRDLACPAGCGAAVATRAQRAGGEAKQVACTSLMGSRGSSCFGSSKEFGAAGPPARPRRTQRLSEAVRSNPHAQLVLQRARAQAGCEKGAAARRWPRLICSTSVRRARS